MEQQAIDASYAIRRDFKGSRNDVRSVACPIAFLDRNVCG
jgi:hypothetical protein